MDSYISKLINIIFKLAYTILLRKRNEREIKKLNEIISSLFSYN